MRCSRAFFSFVFAAVTEEFQNLLVAAVGTSCTVLNISYQTLSTFAMSFIASQHLLELKLDGITGVTSADVQRFCEYSPMLRVSDSRRPNHVL